MKSRFAESRKNALPILFGVAIAGAVGWGIFSATRHRPPPAIPAPTPRPEIALVQMQSKTPDADLFSLEPLFLPTKYNTSVIAPPPEVAGEPRSMTFNYPPIFHVPELTGVEVREPVIVPQRVADVVTLGDPPNPFAELGRVDVSVPELPARLAGIAVTDANTGREVLSQDLPIQEGVSPPTGMWDPVIFFVGVDRAGLIGPPVPGDSAAPDDVENFFRDYLVRNFALGSRLQPGFYSIRIGP